ncbi:MAG: histidine kinase [Calothrix sp. FI2-JRJ7]|jgi:signal transduction histidine kinase|nr:histidine kinase [Calothrix sp. FI2-JRJ7]
MIVPAFSLAPELFARSFPFHIILDCECKILQVGEVLLRIHPENLIGCFLDQHFKIIRPAIKGAPDFAAISKQSRLLFLLESLHNGIQLKGQMIPDQEQGVIFFLCSVWVTETNALAKFGLKLKDFAIHDPIVDFLFLLQAQNTALEDAKKLTIELTKKQEELQKALTIREVLAQTAEAQSQKLKQYLLELQRTQSQLIQTEKMSSLGQLVAGIAHEINNPVNFIQGNLNYVEEYIQSLLSLLSLYQKYFPSHPEIEEFIEELDLEYMVQDLFKILSSMELGAVRIRDIVLSLRTFSRLDEAEIKNVDIHEGIDSTLLIFSHKFQKQLNYSGIEIIKDYGNLPLVECYASELNQVFFNIITNAIDVLENNITLDSAKIIIKTWLDKNLVCVSIKDNGIGIDEKLRLKVFDPFFTTKPVGQGTGLGLSICYQIVVDKHYGQLDCISKSGHGAEFIIKIPLRQSIQANHVHFVQKVLP